MKSNKNAEEQKIIKEDDTKFIGIQVMNQSVQGKQYTNLNQGF